MYILLLLSRVIKYELQKVYCLMSARGIASFIYLSAKLVGNMNRRELGHKCVAILRIVALYILVDRLLFSLAHDNTSVYNMTSEAPPGHEFFCQTRTITCSRVYLHFLFIFMNGCIQLVVYVT